MAPPTPRVMAASPRTANSQAAVLSVVESTGVVPVVGGFGVADPAPGVPDADGDGVGVVTVRLRMFSW